MRTERSFAGLTAVGTGLALLLITAPDLTAQDLERTVAVGAVVPVGGLGANRSMGPLLRGGVTLGDRQRRHVRLRLDLEGSWLQGDSLASSGSWRGGTLAAISGFASMVVAATRDPDRTPYFVLGLGIQRLAIAGVTNPYGATFAGRIGAGVHLRVGERTVFAEVVPTLSATDFGTTSDFSTGTVIPLVIGMRF
jgi:hypothetical protein